MLSKEKQCRSKEESMCEMLFIQIFIIIVQYLYLATFSFLKVKNNKGKM